MKRLLLILVLTFSFQSLTKADDIKDFEIEGMSIGDSLLDYFSEDEIKKDKSKYYYPKSDKFVLWVPKTKSYINYDAVQIHFKNNDPRYIIHSIEGHIYFFTNIEKCKPKKKEIYKDIKNIFSNADVSSNEIKHQLDNKSLVSQDLFILKVGYIFLECYDWSKELESKYGDKLSLGISKKEFMDWVTYDAY